MSGGPNSIPSTVLNLAYQISSQYCYKTKYSVASADAIQLKYWDNLTLNCKNPLRRDQLSWSTYCSRKLKKKSQEALEAVKLTV
jgi:hypothetical protein